MHWKRWCRTGDPAGKSGGDYVKPTKRDGDVCAVEGCSDPATRRTWCNAHYRAWRKYGDPLEDRTVRGEDNPSWTGDEVGYPGAHSRVKKLFGPASTHLCVDCLGPARDWSYDHDDPDEKTTTTRKRSKILVVPYSTTPAFYSPRCKPCHTRLDQGVV